MKNFIMGTAMVLICTIFLAFQTDINAMQREQQYIHALAEEAAATAALDYEEGTLNDTNTTAFNMSNGFVKFKTSAGEKGYNIAKLTLGLNDQKKTTKKYYEGKTFNVVIYTFSMCDHSWQKSVNGVNTLSGTFSKGAELSTIVDDSRYKKMLSDLPNSQKIYINYPSTVCIIDAGEPKFSLGLGINTTNVRICKIGTYEYKDFS